MKKTSKTKQKSKRGVLFEPMWIPKMQKYYEDEADSGEEDRIRREKVINRINNRGTYTQSKKNESYIKCKKCDKILCELEEIEQAGPGLWVVNGGFGNKIKEVDNKYGTCKEGHEIGIMKGGKVLLTNTSAVKVEVVNNEGKVGGPNGIFEWNDKLWQNDFALVGGRKPKNNLDGDEGDEDWAPSSGSTNNNNTNYDELYCEVCKQRYKSMRSFRSHIATSRHKEEVKFYLKGF